YKPKKWLFEGQKNGEHISSRSLQKVFNVAVKKAKINKDVTFHSLRHYVESLVMVIHLKKVTYRLT
ncbi:MAG TPA: tyrosine-type recombinase/integrase, partial [Clostridia bacterium]|nr:tyrosine-type recombinase/integrase [Clostridia bacterium]